MKSVLPYSPRSFRLTADWDINDSVIPRVRLIYNLYTKYIFSSDRIVTVTKISNSMFLYVSRQVLGTYFQYHGVCHLSCSRLMSHDCHKHHVSSWKLSSTQVTEFHSWQEWADGHCRFVYPVASEEAKRHASGWAMRNTNNHNVHILKKSCLGVLVCSRRCILPSGDSVHLRPAICDKARKKQTGK